MLSSSQEELAVSQRGTHWDIGNFKFWESSQASIILYVPRKPFLSVDLQSQRHNFSLTVIRKWNQEQDSILSGSLSFTATLVPQYSFQEFERIKENWEKEILNSGYETEQNLQFVRLPIRNLQTQILLDSGIGEVSHPKTGSTNTGETVSFLLELTERGVREWLQGINSQTELPGEIVITYEYPQLLPTVEAVAQVKGKEIFTYLSSVLTRQNDGYYYGSPDQIEAALNHSIQNRWVEISFLETPSLELVETQENLIVTLIEQIRLHLFNTLFVPVSETETMYQLKWSQISEAVELNFTLSVDGGFTWLKGKLSTSFTNFFREINSSYINTVYVEQDFPVSITVSGHSLLNSVALSWSTDEGKLPESIIFGSEGGKREYILTSQKPDNVTVRYQAKIGFNLVKWPIIQLDGSGTVAEGGNKIILQPDLWVRNLRVYFRIRENGRIKTPAALLPGEYLVVNIVYSGSHLTTPIKESSRIQPETPIKFTYIQDPEGSSGEIQLSVFGAIGGNLVRSSRQTVRLDEENVYIVASGNQIQLVSQDSIISESDELAHQLLQSQSSLVIGGDKV
ncbi:MAG: hypothetical protein VKK42_03870 [Lyngbya sp.]|nr:hypothetical protein [Lyngbya sp.]